MRAITLHSYGGPGGFQFEELDQPQPRAGEVLIRLCASTVDPGNVKRAMGQMRAFTPELKFPWIAGASISGLVVEVGDGVRDFKSGDEVFGYRGLGGAYAEYVAVEVNAIGQKPANLTHAEAAAIAVSGQTAALAMDAAAIQAGQTILVLGAAGSVGSAAVQLAKARGANVIAVCRSRSVDRVRRLNADTVIDGDAVSFESVTQGVDAALDTLGGEFETRTMSTLKPNGTLVALVHPPSQEKALQRGVRAVLVRTESQTSSLIYLREMAESGKIKPYIGRAYTFSEAAQGWEDYVSRLTDGKIVIEF
ncbi:NADP-dependent oxidoreductase [Acidipila sp. EB88]|uniref:NADP-dependent oxidoreductase n=1 Tax=Acidipila sp. EB88 TaxID=2305226 RepID=UPI000F5F1560|nr:NADP-dependent oxidoreductase [Acidipila sp. EB88]RRA49315.1 NADP-dependent oxidoreductase [Acidipila sp. EB88]